MSDTPVTYIVTYHQQERNPGVYTYCVVAVFEGGKRVIVADDLIREEAHAQARKLNRKLKEAQR